MKAKEFIPASKPRNFVVKNQKTAGAGAHKDKKRAEKQGDVKHKQKQFEQGVAEGSLEEFASGGSGGNGPFDYGSAIVQIGQDYTETFNDDGDGADAARIVRVGKTFMSKGMSSGIEAFYAMDSFVRDHVAEELMDQGFNVKQDIYAPYKQQMAKANADTDKYRSSPEYAASRADDLKISAIPEKPINSWSKPGEPAASVSMDNASKRNVKAEFEKFKQDVAQRNSLKGVPLKFVVTVGGKPVDIDKLSGQGVAEGRHGYDDAGFSLAPGHDEGEPVYNPRYDRTGSYDRKAKSSQDYNYNTGKPLSNEPKKTGYVFYNVADPQTAQKLGLKQTKSGKWYLPADDLRQDTANKVFGKGRYWEPK